MRQSRNRPHPPRKRNASRRPLLRLILDLRGREPVPRYDEDGKCLGVSFARPPGSSGSNAA